MGLAETAPFIYSSCVAAAAGAIPTGLLWLPEANPSWQVLAGSCLFLSSPGAPVCSPCWDRQPAGCTGSLRERGWQAGHGGTATHWKKANCCSQARGSLHLNHQQSATGLSSSPGGETHQVICLRRDVCQCCGQKWVWIKLW